jgi:hypothetical protein
LEVEIDKLPLLHRYQLMPHIPKVLPPLT